MRELIFATSNQGKFADAAKILKEYEIQLTQQVLSFPEPRSWDVKEIALEKSIYARRLNKPVIVEDSGFYIPALKGFPATQVNFVLQTIGLEGLLKLMKGKDRYCEFRYALAYWEPQFREESLSIRMKGGSQ